MRLSIKTKIAFQLKKNPVLFDFFKYLSRFFDKNEIYELLIDYNKSRKNVTVLQIGAHDGITNDPVREFIVRYRKWQAFLVEPIPKYFEKLQRNYRYTSSKRVNFLRYGISNQTDSIHIYQIKEEFIHQFPQYAHQIASLNKSHLFEHFPALKNEMEKIDKVQIPVITIRKLISKYHLDNFDVLCLDTEGLEYRIMMSFPFDVKKPNLIIYETLHLSSSEKATLYENLRNKGYSNYQFYFDSISLLDKTCEKWKLKYHSHKT